VIERLGNALFAIGISYLIALLIGRFASRIRLPKVTGYLIVGLLAGPSLADILGYKGLIDWQTLDSINILSELALALIMVIIGSQFKFETLRRWGKRLALLSGAEIGITFVLVASAVFLTNYFVLKTILGTNLNLFSSSLNIALFTGIISVATAPAATLLVIREYESEGPVTDLVFALLGLNNLIAIILFNITSFILLNVDGSILGVLFSLLSPVALGLIGGLLISIWAQKLENSIEMQLLVVGVIVANVGAAHLWNIDFFLSCFVTGLVIVNFSPKAPRLIMALKGVDYPLYVMFFIIAGASLHFDALEHIGLLGIVYIVMRSIGKAFGSWIGARIANFGMIEQRWLGYALLAQAGVAIGLSQSLAKMWPDGGEVIQTIILGSVVVFELIGPIAVRQALVRAGEVPVLTLYAKSSPETALEGMHHVVENFRHSIGVPSGHNIESAADILVQHVMRRNVETIREDMPFNEILKFISHSKYDRFPITDRDGNYLGVVDYKDIRDVLVDDMLKNLVVASDLLKPEPLTITPERKLKEVLEIFQEHSNITYLPVVTGEDKKKLAGMVSQNDILAAFRSSASA
jgi:Kef-type K+ transport system membrane component KefB/CBS domain-containing protein